MYSWRGEFPHFPLTPVVPGMPVLTTGTNTLGQHVSLDPDHTIFLKKSSLSVIPNILSPPCLETFEFYDSSSFHGLSESPSPGQALMTHYWWNVFACSGLVPKSHRKSKFVPLRCSVWNTQSSKFDLVGKFRKKWQTLQCWVPVHESQQWLKPGAYSLRSPLLSLLSSQHWGIRSHTIMPLSMVGFWIWLLPG